MDRVKLENWLDEIIEAERKIQALKFFDNEQKYNGDFIYIDHVCELYNTQYFQLYKGIEKIADALDLELFKENDRTVIYKYKDCFLVQQRDEKGELK